MKNTVKLGIIGLLGLMVFATACKKSPAANLYKTWELADVNLETDQVTVDQMLEQGITYSFKKDGTFSTTFGGQTANGTFEVNETATSLTSTLEGETEMFDLQLTENNMKLTQGSESMSFTAKK
jgi:hypothetical protein